MKHILRTNLVSFNVMGCFLRLSAWFSEKCVMACLLLFISNAALASHFKGGQITYEQVGNGRYDIIIIGYWDHKAVGSINPRYEGNPVIHDSPQSISKTLLPDGKTIEHVQRQTVTWSDPGVYKIYWQTCCRAVGSNFNNNENGLFAIINYNPAQPSSSPQFYDLPIFNYGPGQSINYMLNMEDRDGHEQEYSLEIPYGLAADAYKNMLESGFDVKNDGTLVWENPLPGLWLVNVKLREKINGGYTGAYIMREFLLRISSPGENTPPLIKPVQSKTVKEGQSLTFEIEASDAADQLVKIASSGSGYGQGANFSQITQGNQVKGNFTWTPEFGAAGTYKVQFVATDNDATPLSSQINVTITVEACKALAVGYTVDYRPCAGGSNGKISLSAVGNEGGTYSYSLNNGATFQTSSLFDGLVPGNYIGLIKDATGCLSEPVNIELKETPLPVVTLKMPSSIFCYNSGAVLLTGGLPAGGVYSGTGVENGVFSPEAAGIGTHIISYTFTDNNGCSNSVSSEVVVTNALVADAGTDKEVFLGYPEQTCTTLKATATGGNAPYTYKWSTGATTSSVDVCPTATTTYTVKVTDALGCTSVSDVMVTVYNIECGSNSEKVLVCHKGKTICIEPEVAKDHLGHGDTLGACSVSGESENEFQNSSVIAQSSTKKSSAGNMAAIKVFPNPLTDASQISIITEEATIMTVDVIDLSGNVARKLFDGSVEAKKELILSIGSGLSGKSTYVCRVITSNGVQHFKLLKF